MRRKATIASSLALVAAGIIGLRGDREAGAAVKLQPGEYTMTITYAVQDQRQNGSHQTTRCITARDLDNPEAIFSDQIVAPRSEEAKCSVTEWKDAGGKVSYDADCPNRRVHVEGSLSETEFTVVRTVTPKASPRVLLTFVVAGKRTGACEAKAGAALAGNTEFTNRKHRGEADQAAPAWAPGERAEEEI